VVVICDPRVVTKRYGRGLLEALPEARRVTGKWTELVRHVKQFYGG
jgi:ATP-dependent DNA helicase DinG